MNPAPKSATYDASTENPRRDCVARTLAWTWPNRVWEEAGHDQNGYLKWASRPVTMEDVIRRRKAEKDLFKLP